MPSRAHQVLALASLTVILCSACSSKEKPHEVSSQTAQPTNAAPADAPASAGSPELKASFANVQTSLKGGSFDDAAAQLLKMRASGHEFSQKDGAAYREALSEAYSRALEAASKGDPRAKAAVQMIRAAGSR